MVDMFKLISSPQPYQVYQRSGANTADIEIKGEVYAGTQGVVEARLARGKDAISSAFRWRPLHMQGAAFSGILENVPVGGPYRVELRVKKGKKASEVHTIFGVLVGDLWILAGQSNMDGCGKLTNLESPSKYVNCFYYGDYWGVAKDPLCSLNESIDPVHWGVEDPVQRAEAVRLDRCFREFGAGLGVRFGKDMYKTTGVPVGLLMCSHGGTSMEQWSPKLKKKGGHSLYGCMMRRVQAAGGRVAGCLWYQGESDTSAEAVKVYRKAFSKFIQSMRADLDSPDLPFFYVQLGPLFTWDQVFDGWNKVQEDQRLIEGDLHNVAFAAAIDCTLSDVIHLDAVSQRRLGARLAKLARKTVFGAKIEKGPRPGKIEFDDEERTVLVVHFNGINGTLTPVPQIKGFRVESDGSPLEIAGCKFGRDRKSVVITLTNPVPQGSVLWYARGLNPVCNLKDRMDFPVPMFGPITI